MPPGRTEQFQAALERVGVTYTRTTTADFQADLADAIDEPAVGSPLPDGLPSLDGTAVNSNPTPADLQNATSGVTSAAFGIAESGSVVVRSWADLDEAASLFPERHVVVLRADDVVPDVPSAIERLGEEVRAGRGDFVIATGPSATADMGDLVYGAHGPREVHVLLVEEEP